jgi:hypothetical protein
VPFALRCDCDATVWRDLNFGWTYSRQNELAFLSSLCAATGRGGVMSSYASYCQDQAADCARRVRLASSPEMVAYCRSLELRWLKLAAQAQETGGALGHESDPAATMSPLPEKPATYPMEYGKRAGELIARGARSLSPAKANIAPSVSNLRAPARVIRVPRGTHWQPKSSERPVGTGSALAEQIDDPEAKRTMLAIADDYERLAKRAEERAVCGWPQSK